MFTHAHVSMITYRVDIYRSRPIGASLLTTIPQPGSEGPAHRGWLGVVTSIRLMHMHIIVAATAERHEGVYTSGTRRTVSITPRLEILTQTLILPVKLTITLTVTSILLSLES